MSDDKTPEESSNFGEELRNSISNAMRGGVDSVLNATSSVLGTGGAAGEAAGTVSGAGAAAGMIMFPSLLQQVLSGACVRLLEKGLTAAYAKCQENNKRKAEELKKLGGKPQKLHVDYPTYVTKYKNDSNNNAYEDKGGNQCQNKIPDEDLDGEYLTLNHFDRRGRPECTLAGEIYVDDYTDLSPAKIRHVRRFDIAADRFKPFANQGSASGPFFNGVTVRISSANVPANLFQNCTGIETVVFTEPDTVIGDFAFASCTDLKKVVFASRKEKIDKAETVPKPSNRVPGLRNPKVPEGPDHVVIEASVKKIGHGAFALCNITEPLILPNVDEIGVGAFYNGLKSGVRLPVENCELKVLTEEDEEALSENEITASSLFGQMYGPAAIANHIIVSGGPPEIKKEQNRYINDNFNGNLKLRFQKLWDYMTEKERNELLFSGITLPVGKVPLTEVNANNWIKITSRLLLSTRKFFETQQLFDKAYGDKMPGVFSTPAPLSPQEREKRAALVRAKLKPKTVEQLEQMEKAGERLTFDEKLRLQSDRQSSKKKSAKIEYSNMKVTELREECKKRGLSSRGIKADLVARLEEADRNAGDEL